MVQGYDRRREEEAQDLIALAWWIALLQRQRKLPPLSRLLRPGAADRMRSAEERRREYEELKAEMGERSE